MVRWAPFNKVTIRLAVVFPCARRFRPLVEFTQTSPVAATVVVVVVAAGVGVVPGFVVVKVATP